jgi:two-component system chemotaxis sensor kinase CheA
MLARAGSETYAIPTTSIEQIVSLATLPAEAQFAATGKPMITVNECSVATIPLAVVLDWQPTGDERYIMVLASGEQRMGLLVDDLIAEQEMVVKSLNPELARVRHITGATLLGSGEVALILNVAELIKTAQNRPAGVASTPPAAKTVKATGAILVVDDSITTRTLEKNILEAAGYEVYTAKDGIEALDVLERTPCALIVADVEMPHMDGFDLTIRVRQHERFSQLPVILVTSLDTQEYKARGFQVGADAYIAKGHFDQGELLQTVRQFLGSARS